MAKMTIEEAAQTGDKLTTLIALRDKLARTIDNCDSGRDMASNSKRLVEVLREIDECLQEDKQKEAIKEKEKAPSKHDLLLRKTQARNTIKKPNTTRKKKT